MSSSWYVRLCAVLVVVLAGSLGSAWGCSCGVIGSNPPCQAAWNASAVFTGTVLDIIEPSPPPIPSASTSSTSGRRTVNDPPLPIVAEKRIVHIKIGEVLTGVNGLQEIVVVTGKGGGDCGYDFHRGGDYVVYASKNAAGQLETGICSRTRPLADAAQDVAYIHAVATAPPTGEIRIVRGLPGAVPAAKVSIEGNGVRYELTTDAAGEATLGGVPPGEYKLRAERDRYLPVERTLQVHAKGCAEMPLFMALDRRIQGRVFTKDGLPAANVRVESRPTQDMLGDTVNTDQDGRYELRHFTAGGYYLGINLQQPPTVNNPYTRWFYPGTENIDRAAVIYFSEEAENKQYDLVLPEVQHERTAEGTVFWPDGRPAAGALVLVLDSRWLWQSFVSRATVDANGHFALRGLLDGTQYRLHAVAAPPRSGLISAEPVDVQPGKDPLNLMLVLSKPGSSANEDQRKGVEQYRNKR